MTFHEKWPGAAARLRGIGGWATVQVALLALVAAGAVRADDEEHAKFLQDAIQSDIAEVKVAELALQRSNDDRVRDLAHRLQTDHSVSMQEAAKVAKDLGTRIPSAATPESEQHYASLARLSGADFDAAFVNHSVEAHREAVRKFDEQTQSSPNDAVASLAAKALPTLKEHLAMSEALLGAGEPHGVHGASDDAASVDSEPRVPAETPERRRQRP